MIQILVMCLWIAAALYGFTMISLGLFLIGLALYDRLERRLRGARIRTTRRTTRQLNPALSVRRSPERSLENVVPMKRNWSHDQQLQFVKELERREIERNG